MRLRIQVLSLALAILLPAGVASAAEFGVQGFGGIAIPIKQDDNDGKGTTFGARFPISGSSAFSLEPYIYAIKDKDTEATFGGVPYTRSGISVTTVGINLALAHLVGSGFKFYPFIGVNSNTMRRDEDEITKIGFNGGLGLGIHGSKVMFDLRGDFNMAQIDDTSRKWVGATAGLGFRLGPGY